MRTAALAFFLVCLNFASIYAGSAIQADTVTFTSSNLPIIIIDTEGQSIIEDERISVKMGIINNPNGQRNFLTDTFTDYDGRISIEIRGSSSASFEKKSYGFETQDENGENNNVSLLSMPAENDWILFGPYSDKTLLRNTLPFFLARELGQYASRTEFCELLINGEYKGLYVLMEKIKRDKNRVDIAELNPEDIEGDELTGGYIIKVDKPYNVGWQVDVEPPGDFGKVYFQFHYPKEDELMLEQKAYIQNFIFQFENCLVGSNFADTVNGYAKYIDVNSFVDHFLIEEFTKCLDCYRFSFFMYKQKDSDGGKLCPGPIWDFDLAFGNFGEGVWEEPWTTVEWNAEIPAWYRVFWMKRLLEDENFRNKLKARWIEIRQGAFSNYNILEYINQTVTVIEEARIRNFTRWEIIGKYVWPNYFVGATYEAEVDYLKNWVTERLNWMDIALAGTPLLVDKKDIETAHAFSLQQNYPNPFNPSTIISYRLPELCSVRLNVYNLLGKEIITLVNEVQNAGEHSIDWNGLDSNNNQVSSGVYFYRLETETSAIQKKMLLVR